jgi:demethylmenaquinone methyltransferase/2-methoxy-6-polyprenyl-1,4-benzoquinol methylase
MTDSAGVNLATSNNKIRDMFQDITPRYDFLNRVMSLGRDLFWRHNLTRRLLVLQSPGNFLDLATGTGDQLISIKAHWPDVYITGLDFSLPMLNQARAKLSDLKGLNRLSGPAPALIHADALKADLPPESFDSISISFGLRNINPRKKLYQRVIPLLKPGGRFLILEMFLEPRSPWAPLYHRYLTGVIPFIAGKIFQCSAEAYRYLGSSIERFPHPESLIDELKQAGLTELGYHTYTFGVAMLVWGHRPL